ncbi:alpha/beta hydrolase family protein [Massilia sp. TSP1-1-2]|uniref:alpha/beta hydrolase family protein n=1 Tax=unclassified Massilia TaxID=2609279 RepID=UPI003CEF64A1
MRFPKELVVACIRRYQAYICSLMEYPLSHRQCGATAQWSGTAPEHVPTNHRVLRFMPWVGQFSHQQYKRKAGCLYITSLIATLLLAAGVAETACAASAAPSVQEETLNFGMFPHSRYTLLRNGDPPVRYYLSHAAKKSPLVLFIQGSGCTPPFTNVESGKPAVGFLPWIPWLKQGSVVLMAVEKPYQPSLSIDSLKGAEDCPKQFNAYFSYDQWLTALRLAVQHALTLPNVDPRHVLIIGISEGSTMAAGLARAIPDVTHVALLGSSGPTQLYDFAANIYRLNEDDGEKLRRLQELDATVSNINADSSSTSKFAWGHTYLRWSSFFAQSSADNLSHARARVYLGSGMRDNSTPILSTEVMYAQLRAQNRDVTFRRVPLGGHGVVPDNMPYEESLKEFDAVKAWFEQR